jgi:hypothetical protein
LVSYNATTSIVFAQYALAICDVPITPARQTTTALAVCTVAVAREISHFLALKYDLEPLDYAVVSLSTKWSLRIVNFLAVLKVLSLTL